MHRMNKPDEHETLSQRTFLHLWQLSIAVCNCLHLSVQLLKLRLQQNTIHLCH